MFFQDDPNTQSKLRNITHLDKEATLNDCMSEYEDSWEDTSYERTFIFFDSDLANKIFDLFKS